jgi:hypothetical protein
VNHEAALEEQEQEGDEVDGHQEGEESCKWGQDDHAIEEGHPEAQEQKEQDEGFTGIESVHQFFLFGAFLGYSDAVGEDHFPPLRKVGARLEETCDLLLPAGRAVCCRIDLDRAMPVLVLHEAPLVLLRETVVDLLELVQTAVFLKEQLSLLVERQL